MVMSIVCLNPGVLNLVDRDLRQLGRDFSKNGGMRQPIIRAVREVIIPSIEENFRAGGRPEPWEELTSATIERRGGTSSPLIKTRKLLNAATAFARWTIRGNEARFGNLPPRAWYGVVHQTPEIAARAMNVAQASSGSTGIPVRPFVMVQEEDMEPIRRIFVEWINERVERRLRRHYV